jgi:xanthine dehydrogenase accessory factor
VGQAVAVAGELADFEIVVVEDRDEFLDPTLYPDSVRFEQVDREYSSDFLAGYLERDLHIAIVTRCWETDSAALAAVLRQAPSRLAYLGLMGSERKVERVRDNVIAAGHSLESVDLRAPIGLPIGGDSPGEIAIAIVGEILAERRKESAQ